MSYKNIILELRDTGLSYNKIAKRVGCAKSTVCYHCGVGQKEKKRKYIKEYRTRNTVILKRKIWRFVYRKVRDFKRREQWYLGKEDKNTESYNEFYDKLSKNPTCYLTGRKIDLTKSNSYNLDHVIPATGGGKNTLDNCDLVCKDANYSKAYLTLEEYLSLCKEVLKNFGYEVVKIN